MRYYRQTGPRSGVSMGLGTTALLWLCGIGLVFYLAVEALELAAIVLAAAGLLALVAWWLRSLRPAGTTTARYGDRWLIRGHDNGHVEVYDLAGPDEPMVFAGTAAEAQAFLEKRHVEQTQASASGR